MKSIQYLIQEATPIDKLASQPLSVPYHAIRGTINLMVEDLDCSLFAWQKINLGLMNNRYFLNLFAKNSIHFHFPTIKLQIEFHEFVRDARCKELLVIWVTEALKSVIKKRKTDRGREFINIVLGRAEVC